MASKLTDSPLKSDRSKVISVLDGIIGTIDFAKELVPIELAKGVLSSMSSILAIARDTMKNKDDFIGVAEDCRGISVIILHASNERAGHRVDDPVFVSAIEDLRSTVEKIRFAIDDKSRRHLAMKIFSFSVDKDEIAGWKVDLARALQLFSANLNVLTNVKLDELIEKLEGKLEEERPHPSETLRQPPPAKPVYFFGRVDLVREIAQLILEPQHVVLTGPGGIGKTSIAKAVVNDEEIIKAFGEDRFFVGFNDHDTANHSDSMVTFDVFASRIANALGLQPEEADTQKIIMSYLANTSQRVLLIFDNAETILHAGKETGRIATMIEELGALPSVAIMLTTRSLALPPNLHCKCIPVPPLALGAAREAFNAIYRAAIDTKTLDFLLNELDLHPLSINLLAQAAYQNQWSESDLTDTWKKEKTRVLTTHNFSEGAAGKNQSLAVSINLSLNSPAFQGLGSQVHDFLRILAFLPQGADVRRLEHLMPSISNSRSVVDALCRLSLTYRKDEFVTMLAPIRMYMLSDIVKMDALKPLSQSSLLEDVRNFYTDLLRRSMPPPPKRNSPPPKILPGTWIREEDVNLERLLAYDMDYAATAGAKQMDTTSQFCVSFVELLCRFKPRTTILEEKIKLIPLHRPRRILCLTLPTMNNRLLFTRAWGFFVLGELAGRVVGEFRKGLGLLKESFEIFRALDARFPMVRCLSRLGSICHLLGDFAHAEKHYADALKIARASRDRIVQGQLNVDLAKVSSSMGRPNAAHLARVGRELLEGVPHTTNDIGFYTSLMRTSKTQGYIAYNSNDVASAKRYFEECFTIQHQIPSQWFSAGHFLAVDATMGLCAVALREGEFDKAMKLLDTCRTESLRTPAGARNAANSLAIRASLAAERGDFEAARAQADQAIAFAQLQGEGNIVQAVAIYLRGRIELLAGDFALAPTYFNRTIGLFEALSDIRFKSRSYRALGEISAQEGKNEDAARMFGKAKALCDEMGIRPEFLYMCLDTYALPKEFSGWQSFLDGQSPSA
ncbi:TPR-like protein [Schizopora paradoxa]|uniref:TPR-like protein n=1 Tax=Schizopora paradoxa TaxID=27342 RepID=A0A0H2RQA8_9AGAM|nr:TPR-like protein [Schizopora paradoxa]